MTTDQSPVSLDLRVSTRDGNIDISPAEVERVLDGAPFTDENGYVVIVYLPWIEIKVRRTRPRGES